MRRFNIAHAVVIALFFGVFQALMPLAGWLLGATFAQFIEPVDHWIAFGLLSLIGAKMIWDGAHGDEVDSCDTEGEKLDIKELFLLAIATSIDALAVGISLAFLNVDIFSAIGVIGVTTFILSLAGVLIGNFFGARFEKGANIAGGIVLILIGTKILLEHLGIF